MKTYTVLVLIFMLAALAENPTQPIKEPESCIADWNLNPTSKEYRALLSWYEEHYDLPEGLLFIVMMQESSGDLAAVSSAGAQGLFQFMPRTAEWLGIDPFDPYEAAAGAARYLSQLISRFDGNLELGLAAYNAGPGNVRKYGNTIPPFAETQKYVASIKNKLFSKKTRF